MGPFGSNIKAECFVEEGIPVLNGSNLTSYEINDGALRYITIKKAQSLGRALASRGDVIVTHRGTLGQISYIPDTSKFKNYIISQSQFRMRLNKTIVMPEYFVYYFHTPEGQWKILSNKTQTGVPALGRPTSTFKKLSIPLPSLSTQAKVVEFVHSIQRKINTNNQINDYLYECCTAKMQEIVAGSTGTMTVDDCCDAIYSGGTPSTKKPAYWDGDLPWLSSGETRSRFIIDTEKTITELGVNESSTKLAKAGDVVMASAGQGFTRGQTSMLFFDTYVNQSVVVMRPKQFYGAYLLLMLASQYDSLRAWSDSTSTRGSMSGKLLRQFDIPSIDSDQARELADSVAPIFALIENNLRESKSLEQTRDALLPKLMSGEIDVSKVDITQLNNHLARCVAISEIENWSIEEAFRAFIFIHFRMLVQESLNAGIQALNELAQIEINLPEYLAIGRFFEIADMVAISSALENPELNNVVSCFSSFYMRSIAPLMQIDTAKLIAITTRKVIASRSRLNSSGRAKRRSCFTCVARRSFIRVKRGNILIEPFLISRAHLIIWIKTFAAYIRNSQRK